MKVQMNVLGGLGLDLGLGASIEVVGEPDKTERDARNNLPHGAKARREVEQWRPQVRRVARRQAERGEKRVAAEREY